MRPTEGWASVGPQVRCFAIDDSRVHLVDRSRMDAWMCEPVLAANLVRLLAAQVADRELAVAIALEPRVERRLLLKLRQLAERWGRVTPDGIRLDLRLTHQELANMVGAVRESVTIALGRLAEARARSRCATAPCSSGPRSRRSPRRTSPPRRDPALRPRGPYSLDQSAWGTAGGTRRRRGHGSRSPCARGTGRCARPSASASTAPWPSGSSRATPSASRASCAASCLLDVDTTPFRELHGDDPLIGAQLRRRPGLRPVRRGTVTQALVAAVAGQLITSREASAIEWRITARAAPACGGLRLPPTRAEIAALSAAELAACGLSPSRAATLARLVRTLDPEALHDQRDRRRGLAAEPASAAWAPGRPASRPSGASGAWTWVSWGTSA